MTERAIKGDKDFQRALQKQYGKKSASRPDVWGRATPPNGQVMPAVDRRYSTVQQVSMGELTQVIKQGQAIKQSSNENSS